jgi:tRNA threonylcarbamoyladenosine biosynthesis protein TsaE
LPSPSPNTRSWASSSAEDTERLGAAVAAVLGAGDIVHVSGELGVGKTVFVRGACRALGVTGPITSPTYTVGNLYRAGGVPIAHIDLYRSAGVTVDEAADLEPYFDGTICFVEWPDAGARMLPPPRLSVAMRVGEGDARLIELRSNDAELLNAIGDPLV